MTCLCSYLPKGKICVQCAAERGLFPSFTSDGERKGDARRGLCIEGGCEKVSRLDHRCDLHYGVFVRRTLRSA